MKADLLKILQCTTCRGPFQVEAPVVERNDGEIRTGSWCGMGRFADVVSRRGGTVVEIDLSTAVEAAYDNIGWRPTRWAATIVSPLRTPYRLIHRFYSVRGYARATAQRRFHLQRIEFYNFPLLPRPFDVLWPRLTAATVRLATGLHHTALWFCGTGFVAVSTLDSSSSVVGAP